MSGSASGSWTVTGTAVGFEPSVYAELYRTVTYWKGPNRRPRPAIVTGFASGGGVILRVGHHGETYGDADTGILEREERTQTNVWGP